LIYPGVKIKAIKGNTLFADWDFNEIRSDFRIKAVSIHAQIERRIPESDKPWSNALCNARMFHESGYSRKCGSLLIIAAAGMIIGFESAPYACRFRDYFIYLSGLTGVGM
jgi:hypothetical protein